MSEPAATSRSASSPSPPTMTASGSTAGSSATCPTRASTSVSRWARTGQLRVDGKRAAPGDRIEAGPDDPRAAGRAAAPTPRAKPERAHAQRRRDRLRRRDGDPPRPRRRSSSTSRPASPRRAAPRPIVHLDGLLDGLADEATSRAQAGPPARQGHVGRPAARPHAARRGLLLEELFRPHRAQGLLGAGRRRARHRGRHDRPAARQAAGHRRREDACRRGGGPAVAHPLPGDRARRQPRRLGRASAADRPHAPAPRPYGGDRPSDRRRRQIWRPGRLPDRRDQPQAAPPRPAAADRPSRRRPDRRHRRAARRISPRASTTLGFDLALGDLPLDEVKFCRDARKASARPSRAAAKARRKERKGERREPRARG